MKINQDANVPSSNLHALLNNDINGILWTSGNGAEIKIHLAFHLLPPYYLYGYRLT